MQICEKCQKPSDICVCDRITALSVSTRVLLLQHPEERDILLSTAPLLALMVKAKRSVGVTWGSFSDALEEPGNPKEWGVLYPHSLPKPIESTAPCLVIDHKGEPLRQKLTGIIALDGTWSQAKSIWWQNAWLLRHPRILLNPTEPSIYGKMRQEPRRNAVSTLEAVAEALVGNGENPTVRTELRRVMRTMVQRARDAQKTTE